MMREGPEGRPIDPKYPLKETPSGFLPSKTEWIVRDSDATALFSTESALTGASLKTVDFGRKHQKPNLHLCTRDTGTPDKLKAFVQGHGVKALNVAGPRASKEPLVVGVCGKDLGGGF
jgi:putative molybdenum carrier protein